ncbi:MAG: transcriptional regulator, AbrB family [Deltaproteobacteria bacterium]|nr:transcriptional regulator, AbrB family [Deltaproteobacteria bacterium]
MTTPTEYTGDKLAVISWEKEGRVCCLALVKAEEFSGMLKGMLGPLMGGMEERR